MSFFNQIVNKLFSKEEIQNTNQPFLREELKRNSNQNIAYSIWLQGEKKEQVCSFIYEQFAKSKVENENVSIFRSIESGTTKGFMLRFLAQTEKEDFTCLFDHLKNKTKELNYIVYSSDVRLYNRNEFVEKIERHYLKPSWRVLNTKAVNNTGKMNQLYGNVTIEHHLQNDEPQFIKFVCQHYNDSKYNAPLDFNELLYHICN